MTTLRKWRFPILIGGGLIAAGVLLYFSGVRILPEKIQGAIGKRDVYRDGQVASADVDRAGTAPVAVKAVLESGEFKALAKNAAFQEVLKSDAFAQLSKDQAFVSLLANVAFQNVAQQQVFAALLQSSQIQGSGGSSGNGPTPHHMFAGLEQNAQFAGLMNSVAFQQLNANAAFAGLVQQAAFVNLVSSGAFQALMANSQFAQLASQQVFQNALLAGSSVNLAMNLRQ